MCLVTSPQREYYVKDREYLPARPISYRSGGKEIQMTSSLVPGYNTRSRSYHSYRSSPSSRASSEVYRKSYVEGSEIYRKSSSGGSDAFYRKSTGSRSSVPPRRVWGF